MGKIIGLLVVLLTSDAFAQDDVMKAIVKKEAVPAQKEKKPIQANVAAVERYERTTPTPQSEVSAALKFACEMSKQNPEKAQTLRFFSTYNIPENKQEEIFYELSFWIHSMVAPGFNIVAPPKRVPYSPTLYYVYFDDYGWLRESWEFVAKIEPYFRAPWVHFEDLNNLRLATVGNSIVRADWFIMNTSDTTRQFDVNDENILYYILQYGKGKEPKNLKEFQDLWGVDLKDARDRGLDSAAILKSYIVSRHNRQLLRNRTATGYYWETFDVKNETRERDYIENLFPDDNARDASEAIASNGVGLQTYLLVAFDKGKDKRVEFGDPTVVKSIRDPHGDVRVRTARSCVTCHAEGIISFKHELRRLLTEDKKFCVELAARKKEIQLEIQRFYFGPIEDFVEDDKIFFKRAMKQVNCQTPIDNTIMFNNVMLEYDKPVDLDAAARECGVSVDIFTQRIQLSVSGRLVDLLKPNSTIPRTVWENPVINAGTFGHAMLFVSAIQKKDIEKFLGKQGALNPTIPQRLNRKVEPAKTQPATVKKQEEKIVNTVPQVPQETKKLHKAKLKAGSFIWAEKDKIPEEAMRELWFRRFYEYDWTPGATQMLTERNVLVEDEYRTKASNNSLWRKIRFLTTLSSGNKVEIRWYATENDLMIEGDK